MGKFHHYYEDNGYTGESEVFLLIRKNKDDALISYPLLPWPHVPVVAIGHLSSSKSSGCTIQPGQVGAGVNSASTGVGDNVFSVLALSQDRATMLEKRQVERG